jgi:hypothetical protein
MKQIEPKIKFVLTNDFEDFSMNVSLESFDYKPKVKIQEVEIKKKIKEKQKPLF